MIHTAAWVFCAVLSSQDAAKKDVTIEMSPPLKGGGGLGTASYSATAKEAPFLKKVTEKSVAFWSDVVGRRTNTS